MSRLSPRQRQIVTRLAQGRQQKNIARDLGISYSTVRAHLRVARHKTNTPNSLALAVKALGDIGADI